MIYQGLSYNQRCLNLYQISENDQYRLTLDEGNLLAKNLVNRLFIQYIEKIYTKT